MRWKSVLTAAVVAAALSAGLTFAAVQWWGDGGGNEQARSGQSEAVAPGSGPAVPSGTSGEASLTSACLSAADIYQRVRSAVVEITSTVGGGGRFGPRGEGVGSGVVVDGEGHILTNYHVVSGATTIEVRFEDGSTASAQVVGSDPANDLAVIRVEASGLGLVAAPLGDSDSVQVGDPAIAIGNPFNLEGTLTQGVVSAVHRTYSTGANTRPIRDMIQTDAAVNPGNSGGPLLNCRGEVIGINTLLENPTGQNVNVGVAFAVPASTVRRFLPDMLAGGTVSHPWLGIAGQEVTPALAEDLGLSVDAGVYVTLVAAGSPADDAGLHGAFRSESQAAGSSSVPAGGDVILAADGRGVASVEELASYLDGNKKPGDAVDLTVSREGREVPVEATLAEWPG